MDQQPEPPTPDTSGKRNSTAIRCRDRLIMFAYFARQVKFFPNTDLHKLQASVAEAMVGDPIWSIPNTISSKDLFDRYHQLDLICSRGLVGAAEYVPTLLSSLAVLTPPHSYMWAAQAATTYLLLMRQHELSQLPEEERYALIRRATEHA
ncbi:hypothetical protein EST38_g323 [Candolleomyces aberdarensis]|uniref:Uncharacterized protein n=1 Tax=Candolleomyces aberdarensis TaxID=2316362 RepID=A0A4Q2DYL9_9AGAR|nr:hypothetical protein EST38_g323 [Candolleomyces aberdarensis]